jgi:hypothetical protein
MQWKMAQIVNVNIKHRFKTLHHLFNNTWQRIYEMLLIGKNNIILNTKLNVNKGWYSCNEKLLMFSMFSK